MHLDILHSQSDYISLLQKAISGVVPTHPLSLRCSPEQRQPWAGGIPNRGKEKPQFARDDGSHGDCRSQASLAIFTGVTDLLTDVLDRMKLPTCMISTVRNSGICPSAFSHGVKRLRGVSA